ncbi:MAG: TraR/DksA C4-type zinc finger protein [Deltaproteobacteria bacterium]|nr:TraR/DksA C4-type zinc finger protein [Deltaproteobacteria bacterium]
MINKKGTVKGKEKDNEKIRKSEIEKIKKMLLLQKDELIRKTQDTMRDESEFDKDDLPDEIDHASFEYNQSLTLRLRDREQYLLNKIIKALKMIDEGTYGVCESCGDDIDVKRPMARPVATLCIKCKEEQEKREKILEG